MSVLYLPLAQAFPIEKKDSKSAPPSQCDFVQEKTRSTHSKAFAERLNQVHTHYSLERRLFW